MRPRRLLAALVGALVLQILLTGFTSLFTGEGSTYGAPLPVGSVRGSILLGGSEADIDSWPAFAANVAATAAVFWVLLRLGGHALLVPLGSVLFLVLAAVMLARLDEWPRFAGLPLPIARYPSHQVALLALWIDCLSGAVLFGAPGLLRARRDERERRASGDRGRLDRSQ